MQAQAHRPRRAVCAQHGRYVPTGDRPVGNRRVLTELATAVAETTGDAIGESSVDRATPYVRTREDSPIMTRKRFCMLAPSALLLVSGSGCVWGPGAIATGRGVYNEVINRTEDDQLLNWIVHERYNESYGLLAVASVTANIRASASAGGDFGVSRSLSEDYAANLVPLSVGVAFEENPTISYVPLGGETFTQRLISPLSMQEMLSVSAYLGARRGSFMKIGVKSINGIRHPDHTADIEESTTFERITNLWRELRLAGVLRIGRESDGQFAVTFHVDNAEHERALTELLELAKISIRPTVGRLVVPVRVTEEAWLNDAFIFESRSVLEILRAAGGCIDVPISHVKAGVVAPNDDRFEDRFMQIHTSLVRPRGEGAVAIKYRNWWYYVDDADPASKRVFLILRQLVGLRLHKPGRDDATPVLTIPVR